MLSSARCTWCSLQPTNTLAKALTRCTCLQSCTIDKCHEKECKHWPKDRRCEKAAEHHNPCKKHYCHITEGCKVCRGHLRATDCMGLCVPTVAGAFTCLYSACRGGSAAPAMPAFTASLEQMRVKPIACQLSTGQIMPCFGLCRSQLASLTVQHTQFTSRITPALQRMALASTTGSDQWPALAGEASCGQRVHN